MYKSIKFLVATMVVIGFAHCRTFGESVRIYPAPAGEPLSTNFTASVGSSNLPVYCAKVATADPVKRRRISTRDYASFVDSTSFATFDLNGRAKVTVTCPETIREAKVLPSSRGIVPTITGNTMTFDVAKPGALEIEVNGDWVHSFQLFVNPVEKDAPDPNDPNVIYFGPGIHRVSGMEITSGKTVYIAGGAVIYGVAGTDSDTNHATALSVLAGGAVFSLNGNNITLRGRGVIDGGLCPGHTKNLVSICGTNILVEGVVLTDSSTWTMPVKRSANISIKNIKLFGYRGNADGIDICNSHDVSVTDCFLRTMDDLVVVKTPVKDGGESRDITVSHCVLWNELAHALSIGAELRENVEHVRFSDCDIIHDKGREWLLRVYNCDDGDIHDIKFDNIRAEESNKLISLWVGTAVWSKDSERGRVENVTFQNIRADGADPRVDLKGFDGEHRISDIRFRDIVINGKALQATNVNENEFVEGVSVKP
ncbi:MAG TPA: glycosyl hydrolase family 28 protein [Candidatus Sulfotelmatobacter sp.]|nr:glycosyl hydrolase family 28 protein [Candidatus Sulfotelmatobacter sp.]